MRLLRCRSLVVSLALLCAGCGGGLSSGFEGFNLVLISIDTLRADHLGCYGHGRPTPNLDAFAADGFLFESMFTTSSTTFPAHVSLMTGLHPKDSRNGHFLSESVTTLAEILGDHGYTGLAFVSALPLDRRFNLDQGFATYDSDFSSCRGSIRLDRDMWYAHAYEVFDCNARETTERVVTKLGKEKVAGPLFLWVHYFDPHLPYSPPEDTYDAQKVTRREFPYFHRATDEDRRSLNELYDGEIRFVDRYVGKLLDELERLGLRERTIVAIVSDHGENLYEHDDYLDHSRVVYDTVMHVPFLLRLPDRRGRRVDALASLVDVAPTLLDLLGIEHDGFEGRSLVESMASAGANPARAYVSCETNDFGVSDEDQAVAIRTLDMKYIYNDWKRRDDRFFECPAGGGEFLLQDPPEADERKLRDFYREWLVDFKPGELTEPSELDRATREAMRSLGYLQ